MQIEHFYSTEEVQKYLTGGPSSRSGTPSQEGEWENEPVDAEKAKKESSLLSSPSSVPDRNNRGGRTGSDNGELVDARGTEVKQDVQGHILVEGSARLEESNDLEPKYAQRKAASDSADAIDVKALSGGGMDMTELENNIEEISRSIDNAEASNGSEDDFS